MNFNDQHVLVTGGGSGIGLAISQAMVAAGARVTITGRDAAKLEAVAREHPAIIGHVCDVTDDDCGQRRCMTSSMAEGGIDMLVNNAGVMDFFNVLDGYPLEEQRKEIEIDADRPDPDDPSLSAGHAESRGDDHQRQLRPGLCSVRQGAGLQRGQGVRSRLHPVPARATARHHVRVVELLPPVVDTPLAAGIATPFPRMPPEKLAAALMHGLRRGTVGNRARHLHAAEMDEPAVARHSPFVR